MPVPVTNDPVSVRRLPRSLALAAGMMGISASTERPQPMMWLEVCVGGGVKASTLNWRARPETPMESGNACVPTLPGVVIPFQSLKLMRRPPSKSGTSESRCPGRTADTATSRLTGPSAPKVRATRSCGSRENSMFGRPRNSTVQGKK